MNDFCLFFWGYLILNKGSRRFEKQGYSQARELIQIFPNKTLHYIQGDLGSASTKTLVMLNAMKHLI